MTESIPPITVLSKPGCKRDGTLLDSEHYTDMFWARSQRMRVRKMGGYRVLSNLLSEISRGLNIFNRNAFTYVHTGGANMLEQFKLDANGNVSSITDRTPALFATSANNMWQFAQLYDSTGTAMTIIAHAAPNATDIASATATTIWYGDITGTGALTASGLGAASGGVVVAHPYLIGYGSDGILEWSDPNDPTASGDVARITSSKIVRGLPFRAGAGNAPAALFWSLDSLVRMTFVGGSAVFNFDTLASELSILSANSVIEFNGVFYWIAIDHFLMFNGVVRPLPNDMNSNFFFDNVNMAYRNRVYAFKVPRFGEIWWCYPRGNATECTHAIIYNVFESEKAGYHVWYDTPLPNNGRSAAQFAQVFPRPFMTGIEVDALSGKYPLWEHEYGTDEINALGDVAAVQSYYETHEFSLRAPPEGQQSGNTGLELERFQPDFIQSGDMSVYAVGRWNAKSAEFSRAPKTFPATATTGQNETVPYRMDANMMRFHFESNVAGGNYQAGRVLAHVRPSGNTRVNS